MRVTNGISGGRIGYRRIYFYSYDTRESIKQCRIASEKKSRAETISEKDAWAESMPSRKGRTRQNALALKVQRALGIDYGRRHIGVAVSTMGLAPRPLTYIRGGGLLEIMRMSEDVVNVAVEEQCDAIVVGIPVTMDGSLYNRRTDSQQGRRCRNFAQNVVALSKKHGIVVFAVDENGTSQEAGALLEQHGGGSWRRPVEKGKKDSVAAALILSIFFSDPGSALSIR
jgi:putative Holliday junction resolvase